MPQKALLLINPKARQGQNDLAATLRQLQAGGLELIEAETEAAEQLSDVIRAHRDRVDLVIVGGGDGTLNAAIAGLVDTQLPLAILPLGTANDLARTLQLPMALNEACQVITRAHCVAIDLGWVNGHYFFNVASLGLSVHITQQLSRRAKKRWGVLAYALTAIRVLLKSRPFKAEIQVGDEVTRVKTVQIAIGNGRHYGGGMTVAEDAAIDDQRLDLYSLEVDHWWQLLPLLPAMRTGSYASWSFVRTLHGQTIEIRTRYPHPITLDGEIKTTTPAKFRVLPAALKVIVPPTSTRGYLPIFPSF